MIQNFLKAIESEVSGLSLGKPQELYDPIRYIMQLGGKRIRPLLCLISYYLFKEDWDKVVKQALALEVFHNFTLMHDDIMDNAPLRRGKPTIHEKWSTNIGLLSGDVMLVKAYELLAEVQPQHLPRVLWSFNQCATEVCEGQQIDMNFEAIDEVSEEQYLQMISQKTAALLGFSLELGGILSDQNEDVTAHLKAYGMHLGLAFQLTDDCLDVYGDHEKFGKQQGGDIISNKKTYLLIKALQKAEGHEREKLVNWISKKDFDPEQKIQEVKSIYDKLELRKEVEEKVNQYFLLATENINHLKVNDSRKNILESFTETLKRREK